MFFSWTVVTHVFFISKPKLKKDKAGTFRLNTSLFFHVKLIPVITTIIIKNSHYVQEEEWRNRSSW